MAQKHEFDFGMTCEGCSGAAKRVLGKIGVAESEIEIDMEKKKIFVTSDKSVDDLLEALKKTGKSVSHVASV